jgi:uncharacterized membrane protein
VLPLIEHALEYLELAGVAISLFAAAVIIFSFVIPTLRYARPFQEMDREQKFSLFKKEFGSGLMLGLEILVLADVIETMTVTPTFKSLSILASIVVIRTMVSWTLTLEVEGRWPWQAPVKGQKNV